ncbi:hypothetical protein BpHYR1_007543 [Brachionus plicatilis]|uniref:Uncharacterized protein n=1 Tax=Brachionus plicatilis TaxID=10195 RepID=A0A3M7S1H5_BRAPC|nr:hypothetical protein BpHYR1_007543 [Brachionus plicatilis]
MSASNHSQKLMSKFNSFSITTLNGQIECWAVAKPDRSERGQNKATRPAVKNLDREVGRPKQRRTAWSPKWPSVLSLAVHLAVRLCFGRSTSRSKFLTADLAAKVAVRLCNRPSRRSCSQFKKFLAALIAVCTVPNTSLE